ncbi:MAG: S41 family peptidase [Patescibacteria group bacterium]|jgi:carboxyl-terminal processing protease
MEANNKGMKLKRIGLSILFLILLAASFGAGGYFSQKNEVIKDLAKKEVVFLGKLTGKYSANGNGKLSQDVDFDLYWKVWDLLHEQYVDRDKLNEKELFYGSLKGLVAAAGDPYTVFMDPKISEEFSNDLAGTFEGIGAEIGMKDDIITIVAPLPEMPAEKAGLKAGDKIYSIDGVSTAGMSVDEAVAKIRGEKGTEVTLAIFREGFSETKDYKLKRDKIVVKSVRTEAREDGIFVIRVSNFNDDTEGLFNEAVTSALSKNPKGVILDLRNNPGGYLETAIEMASEWVEEGVVVTEKFSEEKKNEYLSRGRARLKDFPAVALVNQGSASASEIVSGALQDTGEAIIIGKETFGKGSVQALEDLPDGSSVKITVAKWLTPKGNNITEKGITPDVIVDLTPEDFEKDKDPQMDMAVNILTGKTTVAAEKAKPPADENKAGSEDNSKK